METVDEDRLTFTSDIQSCACSIVINVHFEALAVEVSSNLSLEYLDQLRGGQYQHGAPRLAGRTFWV